LGIILKNKLVDCKAEENQNLNPTQEARNMKEMNVHKLDLTQIDENGEFPCPKCGIVISPDAPTEEKYSVLCPKVNNDNLEEVVILCNSCGSHIHLTGFSLLQEIA